MKFHLIFAFTLTLVANAEPLKVIKSFQNYLEIEVDARDVKYNCVDAGKNGSDMWGLDVKGDDVSFSFFAARSVPGNCPIQRKLAQKVLRLGGRVVLYGVGPFTSVKGLINPKHVHNDLRSLGRDISVVFIQMKSTTSDDCFGDYADTCIDPRHFDIKLGKPVSVYDPFVYARR